MEKTSISEEGPQCPHCGRQFTADEGYYFDENYTSETCDECNKPFKVEVLTSTSWTCSAEDQ